MLSLTTILLTNNQKTLKIHPDLGRLSLLLSTIYKALVLPLFDNLQLMLRPNE